MFGNKKTILFITKSKIKIVNVSLGRKPKEEVVADVDWILDSLPQILFKFKKNIKQPARILLGEEFVYTVNLTLPTPVSREDIKKKAQEVIPENLDEIVWDFREVEGGREVGETRVQVVAVAKALFGGVSSAVAKAGIRVEAIESLSVSLARFSRKENKAKVFVYITDGDILAMLAQKGIVLATEHLKEVNLNTISQFITFSKDKFHIEVKDVIFCGEISGINIEQYKKELFDDIRLEIQNISPIISLANKEDIRGKDEEVLNLQISSFWGGAPRSGATTPESLSAVGDSGRAPSSLARMTKSSRRVVINVLIVITLITIILLVVAGLWIFQYQQRVDQNIIKPIQNGSENF